MVDASGGIERAGFTVDPLPETGLQTFSGFLDATERELGRLAATGGAMLSADRGRMEKAHERWIGQPAMTERARGDEALTRSAELASAFLQQGPIVHFEAAPDHARLRLGPLLAFWPDGVAAFQLALRVYAAGRLPHEIRPLPGIGDLPLWWSIRENLAEEPGLVQPYLQLLAGEQPEWRYWAAVV